MTIAICVRCGARKFGAFTECSACWFWPQAEDDLIASMALTDHHVAVSELDRIGREIRTGVVLELTKTQADAMRPAIQDYMIKFGPVLAAGGSKKKGETRSRIDGALNAIGVASGLTYTDAELCTCAAAEMAVAVAKHTGMSMEQPGPEGAHVTGLFGAIAAGCLAERLGCSFELVA